MNPDRRIGTVAVMTLPVSAPVKPPKRKADILPQRWQAAVVVPAAMVAVMVIVQVVSMFPAVNLARYGGIQPRDVDGLVGVVTSPYIHGGWWHLLSNAVPFLVFGFLVMVHGVKQFVAVTLVVWLVAGLGVWAIAPENSLTVGASGIVFGWLAYLLARGFFNRSAAQLLLGVVLFAIWGGMFWGLLPGAPGISWQGHLCGTLGGVLAAFLASKADGPRKPAPAKTQLPSFTSPS
jgi:membrane associated rhomboid family serine protease